MRDVRVDAVLLALGAVELATGVLMLAAPATFFDLIASFEPPNDHFIRDLGTFTVAYGAALLWSVRAPAWRLPLIAFGLAQFALHVVNHIADVDAAREEGHGVVNVITLSLGLLLLAWLARAERARLRAGSAGRG